MIDDDLNILSKLNELTETFQEITKLIREYVSYQADDEEFTEMATVGTSEELKLRVQVNPVREKIGNPYLKVFNAMYPKKNETKVARLHFIDSGMEYHSDSFLDWVITNADLKKIVQFFNSSHHDFSEYTNWQVACYLWNFEYGIIPESKDDYFAGKYDETNMNNSSYVRSNQEMPATWEYDPPKNKSKRRKLN